MNMGMKWAIPVLASILILGTFVDIPQAASQTCTPPPPNMVSWWPFDGDATDIQDGNSGTLEGVGGTFVAAKVNSGFQSGGQASLVTVPDAPNLDVTQFTIDAWVRIDAINPASMPIVWKGDQSGTNLSSPYQIFVLPTGVLWTAISDGTTLNFVSTGSALPVGTFTHIAVTADGSDIKIYIDGQFVTSTPQSVTPFANSIPLQIGSLSNAIPANYLNGVIDELEIFNTALSASDIQSIFDAGSAGKCQFVIGGTLIPIDTTALLVAGVQSISMWMIPILVAAVGIGLAVFTLKRSR